MRWVLLAVQMGLAASLVVAGAGKLVAADAFVSTLRDSRLPAALVRPLALAVPAVEVAVGLGVALGTGSVLTASLGAALALLAAFTAWLGWVAGRGLKIDCACFGPLGREVGAATIARNAALLAVAAAGLALSLGTATPFSGPFGLKLVSVGAGGMALALAVGFAAAFPVLVLSRRRLEPASAATGEGR